METKRCLFCDKIVPIKSKDDYVCFAQCSCAPDGVYSLRGDSYEPFLSLSYQTKSHMFPIISAYIRELTDCGQSVALSFADMDTIRHSPRIPLSIEEKADRLLSYLLRRSNGPNEEVVIRHLSENYNLTYSPNLQELVYIIEKLREDELIERTGSIFKLTEKGWREANAKAEGRQLRPCFVYVSASADWDKTVVPKLERCGYFPRMLEPATSGTIDDRTMRFMLESELIIVDLSGRCPDAYFAAGLAFGMKIPFICTIKRGDADPLPIASDQIRPLVWDEPEDLAEMLQQRLKL